MARAGTNVTFDPEFFEHADFLKSGPGFAEFMKLLRRCAKCGAKEKDLRVWPPDAPTAPKYCAPCRLRMAAGLVSRG
jgi:hypothetical protein